MNWSNHEEKEAVGMCIRCNKLICQECKVKINNNMAIGIFKNTLIYIFLEEDSNKRAEMMDKFLEAIMQYIVPIKPGRKNERNGNSKNRYHINQRKTF